MIVSGIRQSLVEDMCHRLYSCGKTVPQIISDINPLVFDDDELFMEIMNILQTIDLEGKFPIKIRPNNLNVYVSLINTYFSILL